MSLSGLGNHAKRYCLLAAIGVILSIAPMIPGHAYPRPGTVERVSDDSTGTQPVLVENKITPVISANGRYVAFATWLNSLGQVYRKDLKTGTVEPVSVGPFGTPALGACYNRDRDPTQSVNTRSEEPSISDNGRYVSFYSCAYNHVPGDTNLLPDVFVRDMKLGTTQRVSVASDGQEAVAPPAATTWASAQAMSADGRYITFSSTAAGLVEGDDSYDYQFDVFVHDRKELTTELVTVRDKRCDSMPAGLPELCDLLFSDSICGQIVRPAISADGRFVAFHSTLDGLVDGDVEPSSTHVFVRDLKRKTTEMVDVATDGSQSRGPNFCRSLNPNLSADGRLVVFWSSDTRLVPNDDSGFDTFVRDRKTGRTERVSVSSVGTGIGGSGGYHSISRDGRFVFFAADTGILRHDRLTGATELVSLGSEEYPTAFWPVSPLGRLVVWSTDASGVVPDDTNDVSDVFLTDMGPALGVGDFAGVSIKNGEGSARTAIATLMDPAGDVVVDELDRGADLIGARVVVRPRTQDLYARLDVTQIPGPRGLGIAGDPSVMYGLRLKADDVSYELRAQHLGASLNRGVAAAFGVFRCDEWGASCTLVADIEGGYGTTGESVVMAVPLHLLGLQDGGTISGLRAFTALGRYEVGVVGMLDTLD